MKGEIKMSDTTIKISLEAYQELVLKKIETGVPIRRQIDDLVIPKKEKLNGKQRKTTK